MRLRIESCLVRDSRVLTPPRGRGLSLVLALVLQLAQLSRGRAENALEYKYEDYSEDHGRVSVRTHSARYEQSLTSAITAKATLVYDSISGATPTGEIAPPGSSQVPLVNLEDIRRAGSLDVSFAYGRHTTTPQISYSRESDYESIGLALNHAIEFNNKNTTLNLGFAENIDRAKGSFQPEFERKDTWDFLVGVNQLLGPGTYLTVNGTVGYASGFLTDPYKGVYFSYAYPDAALNYFPSVIPEKRPDHRLKEVLYTSLTHRFARLNGVLESSYRLHHDDYGVIAHTVGLTWLQSLGRQVVVSPAFRYYRQTAADFYAYQFTGDPLFMNGTRAAFQNGGFIAYEGEPDFPADPTGYQIVQVPGAPRYYSADYRLSELQSFTLGLSARWRPTEHLAFDFGYKRYIMDGLDGVTPASAYPSAHVFTVGMSILF